MKTRTKTLAVFVLSLLLVTALAGCGQADTPDSGVSVTVEVPGVYEIVADAPNNSESTMNADSSEMSGNYYLETTPPCTVSAYDKNHIVLATIDLSGERADSLVQLTLNDSMEFVKNEG